MCGQTQNGLQIAAFKRKCDNCNADVEVTHRCNSCCNVVCTTCMTEDDPCCLSCQEFFPVASSTPVHTPTRQSSGEFDFDKVSSEKDACVHFHMVMLPTEQQGVSQNDDMMASFGFGEAKAAGAEHMCGEEGQKIDGPSSVQEMHGMWLAAQAAELERQADMLVAEARKARLSAAALHAAEQANQKTGTTLNAQVGRTMMICDIPCRINRDTLVETINAMGYAGTYDFIHLPCRYGHENTNIGYGFVNFFDSNIAENFAAAFQGYIFPGYKSTKKCSVKVAKHQGFNANLHSMRHRKKMTAVAN